MRAIILCCLGSLAAAAIGAEAPADLDLLRAEIDTLKRRLLPLEKRVAELEAELAKHRARPVPEVKDGTAPASTQPGERELRLGDLVDVLKRAADPKLTDLQREQLCGSVRGKKARLTCVVREVHAQLVDGLVKVDAEYRSREEATGDTRTSWSPQGAKPFPRGSGFVAPVVYCRIMAFVPQEQAAKMTRSQTISLVGTLSGGRLGLA